MLALFKPLLIAVDKMDGPAIAVVRPSCLLSYYEKQHQTRVLDTVRKRAEKLGFQLIPAT